jgi:biotin carboxyl carrier protein
VPETVKVRAEWPGRVDEVHVSEGEAVDAGTDLITLESMKMLNEVKSPVAGTVATVHVAPDASVEEDDVLVDIEVE